MWLDDKLVAIATALTLGLDRVQVDPLAGGPRVGSGPGRNCLLG